SEQWSAGPNAGWESAGRSSGEGSLSRRRIAIALHRRKRTIVGAFAATTALGALVVARLPAQYRAETTIKVIDARPPSEYVHPSFATPAISDLVGERMKALRLHILNWPLLIEVARELGLASDDDSRAIERLREQFDFRVEGADTFTVSYTDGDPARSEAVIN